ncbi:MAG: 3-dehydroquinate synthase family protein [Streptosporangiaceae bacterium]
MPGLSAGDSRHRVRRVIVRYMTTTRQAARRAHARPAADRAAGTAGAALDRQLRFGTYSYPFAVRSGPAAWEDLGGRLEATAADRFAVVVTDGVPAAAAQPVTAFLGRFAPVTVLRIPASEQAKHLAAVGGLAADAVTSGVTRRSVIVGLGGGLAGNVAGLLAALLYRGIRLIHMPTTALALWDSTPSLKQAVNSASGKNHLGTFKSPDFVWGNLDFLQYLPADQIRAGLCEAIKNVVAICPDQIQALAALLRPAADYDPAELLWVTGMCLDAKQSVMRDDPHETGAALACEYGHTCGHMFELVYRLSHGLAIGVGGLVAARVAAILGYLDPSAGQIHEDLLLRCGAPVTVPAGPPARQFLEILRRDNKRGYLPPVDGRIDMVLLDRLGRIRAPGGARITQVAEDVVLEGIRSRTGAPAGAA